jgi:protein-disulfide isomerase
MNKTLIYIVAVVVILLGGMTAWRMALNKGAVSAGELTVPVSTTDNTKGEGDIVLVEYSDFQCPACAQYEPSIRQLMTDLEGKVTFVYRHFPLRTVHLNAQIAAQASEAAALQGKFWEMHGVLFASQRDWENDANAAAKFASYAGQLGMDVEKFNTDIDSDAVKEKVNSDYEGGIRAGINSTPTFFLNGKKIANPKNFPEFKSTVENANTNI